MSILAPREAAGELLAIVDRSVPEGDSVRARFADLVDIVAGLDSCVLALSGGIDSTFLLEVAARLLGPRCLAVTADSPAVPAWDRRDARRSAQSAEGHGARSRVVATAELERPGYLENGRSRCYFCKLEVYGALTDIARAEGLAWIVDGTNADDLAASDRPGTAAGARLSVRSPLAEAGLSKRDVRVLARALGMKDWDRPASACLSSRIPHGVRITVDRLQRVETAELAIRAMGFAQVRVRDFGDRARVEVEEPDLERLATQASRVDGALRDVGFPAWSAAAYGGGGAGDLPDAS